MRTIFLLLFTCLLHRGSAQAIYKLPAYYKTELRIHPLGLLHPYETAISLGFDTRMKNNLYIGGDALVIVASGAITPGQKLLYGFGLKPTLRLYSHKKPNVFYEAVVTYKHIAIEETDWLGMNCVNGVPSYEKLTTYRRAKDVYDASIRTGVRKNLFKQSKCFLELYAGIGVRFRNTVLRRCPPNSCVTNEMTGFENVFEPYGMGSYVFFSVPMGMRLAVILK